jgi:hypothetical protein
MDARCAASFCEFDDEVTKVQKPTPLLHPLLLPLLFFFPQGVVACALV